MLSHMQMSPQVYCIARRVDVVFHMCVALVVTKGLKMINNTKESALAQSEGLKLQVLTHSHAHRRSSTPQKNTEQQTNLHQFERGR